MKLAILASIGGTLDAFFPPLIARWNETGIDVVSAASTPRLASDHTVLHPITRRPHLKNVTAPWAIAAWLRAESADILICNTATASFLARVMDQPTPVIYFCHGLHWNKGDRLSERMWRGFESLALRHTAGVIVINSDDYAWFSRRLPEDRILWLKAGVGLDPLAYPPATALPRQGDLSLLWVGEFSARKRPHLAIEMMAALIKTEPGARLTMCGTGPLLGETESMARAAGLDGNIFFPGRCNDVGGRLARNHATVLTSAWEGLPRIGLESLSVGRPVFAYDVKGTRSLPGVHLAPELDSAALATLIANWYRTDETDGDTGNHLDLSAEGVADQVAHFAKYLLTLGD